MRRMIPAIGVTLVVLMAGCRQAPPVNGGGDTADTNAEAAPAPAESPESPATALGGQVWTLIALGDQRLPVGAGRRPPDLRFDGAGMRATGFAGCNQFGAEYTLAGDSLGFGPIVATKMFCEDGDAVERAFLAMLDSVTAYHMADSTLTLRANDAPLARFRAGPPD